MISERIKKLRKALDLTQQEFADQLNIKRNTVATYEVGKSNPSDAAVILICKTFNVSESWLRTGEGEMFVRRSESDEIAAAVERLLSGESDSLKHRMIIALSTLSDEHWSLLDQKLREIVGLRDSAPTVEQEADVVASLARQQFLSQKKPESPVSSSNASAGG